MNKLIVIGLFSSSMFACSARAETLKSSETRPTIDPSVSAMQVDFNELAQSDDVNPAVHAEKTSANPGILVVNHSNREVCVTITMLNPLLSKGWYVIPNGEERQFSARYIHAEECGNSGVSWNPNWDQNYFCQHPTERFEYFTPDNVEMCSQLGARMTQFYRVPDVGSTYVWTLNY